MYRNRLTVVLVLLVLATGPTWAWDTGHAAARGTWLAAGMVKTIYQFPFAGEGEDLLSLDLTPRVLYFPLDGFGVGADAEFDYLSHSTTVRNVGIGPRAAYYLRRSPWMPFAGLSFLYLNNSVALLSNVWVQTGWKLAAGLGVSPKVGSLGTLPVELSFAITNLRHDTGEGEIDIGRTYALGLDVGLGFFLGR